MTYVKLKNDLNPFQIGIYLFLVNRVFGSENFFGDGGDGGGLGLYRSLNFAVVDRRALPTYGF